MAPIYLNIYLYTYLTQSCIVSLLFRQCTACLYFCLSIHPLNLASSARLQMCSPFPSLVGNHKPDGNYSNFWRKNEIGEGYLAGQSRQIISYLAGESRQIISYLAGHVPPNNSLFGWDPLILLEIMYHIG